MRCCRTFHFEDHKLLIWGLLCGVVTIPVGCFVAGLVCNLLITALLVDLLPLAIFSAIIAVGLLFFPNVCVKIFAVFGFLIKALIIVGLMLGIVNFLSGKPVAGTLALLLAFLVYGKLIENPER